MPSSDTIYSYYDVTPTCANSGKCCGNCKNKGKQGRLAIQVDRPPKDFAGRRTYKVSYAFSSPDDQFNKKVARSICRSRIQSGSYIQIESDEPLVANTIFTKAVSILREHCGAEKARFDGVGKTIKIPNWFSFASDSGIVPSYKPKNS